MPKKYMSIETYLKRIQNFNADQERLKDQQLRVFKTKKNGSYLTTRFKNVISK